MVDIIDNIGDINKLKEHVHAFSQLSRKDRLDLLSKIKQIRTEVTAEFLRQAFALEQDREVQKAIKKLLFYLKTSGVKVEELNVKGEPVLRKIEEKREHRGFISNFDDNGTRMVMIGFEGKRNLYVLIHGLIHFSQGLLELANAQVDGQSFRQIVAEYLKGSMKPLIMAEVSPRYASFIIEEAANLSGRYNEDMKQMKSFLSRLGGIVQKPSDIYALEITEATETPSMERVLSSELFEPFYVVWDTIEDDRKQFSEIGSSSTLVLPPYMVAEKKQEFLKTLVEKGKLTANIPPMKRLLEDYAYMSHALGNFAAFKGLVEILQQPDGPGRSLAFFVQKALEAKEEEEPTGLIVNPYDQVRTPR